MASEDVIELGSSDEEAEPAAKRVKTMPDAMVHIPSKLPGVTIKPTKSKAIKPNPIGKLIGKSVTVTKVKPTTCPKTIRIGPAMMPAPPNKAQINLQKSIKIPSNIMNSINIMKKLNNSQVQINRVPKATSTPRSHPVKVVNFQSYNNASSHLPANKLSKPVTANTKSVKENKRKRNPLNKKVVETVELDDEDPPAASTAAPAWYLRPEESNTSMEQVNNAEPEPTKMIEITIEDSPIKPVVYKRTHEVGAELAITIDDSPVKVPANEASSKSSDNEDSTNVTKVPQSKKKLNYPKTDEIQKSTTIEIELEPIFPTQEQQDESVTNNNDQENTVEVPIEDIVEVQESPEKKSSSYSTPKKTCESYSMSKKTCKEPTKSVEVPQTSRPVQTEFHSVYQEFIDLCLKLENSNDMKTIVEKKIKGYYKQVSKEYVESEEFIDMVQSKILAMKAGPEKLYLYIKDIVDELNLQRKMSKAYQPPVKETRALEAENFQYGEESEFDSKRQRQIRKLEKTLRKLHRAIQKLEEQEVDFDDDEDSVYLLTERYKERMVRVHAKFCQLTNTKMPSEPRIHIDPRPGQPAGPARRLEKWVNKKVPIGKPLPFPDFHDVLRCVRDANEGDKLGWNEADIMEEARDLFTRCGKKLQRRRQENEWRLAASRISAEGDPAETSEDLKKKLESNRQLGHKKEADVFNKFADKQSQLRLEAVEIGDKEAEESPVESEDDDGHEDGSNLESKERRKDRLRRLIQEKSKKSVEVKENEPKDATVSQSDDKLDLKDGESSMKQNDISDISNKDEEMDIPKESENKTEETQRVQSISDDDNVDSDIDELHLLQKLHSDEVNTSTISDSNSDSPIDISDTIQSSSEKDKPNSDVISIENSSYSESDTNMEEKTVANVQTSETLDDLKLTTSIKEGTENDIPNVEIVDSVLLASSDEENVASTTTSPDNNECVNLKDDTISIEETVIQNVHSIENDTNEIISPDLDNNLIESERNTLDNVISESNSECNAETKISEEVNTQANSNNVLSESKTTETSVCSEESLVQMSEKIKSPEKCETDKLSNTLVNGDQVMDTNNESHPIDEITIQTEKNENADQETHGVAEVPLKNVTEPKIQNIEEEMDIDQNTSVQELMDTEVITDTVYEAPENSNDNVGSKQNPSFDSLDTMLEEFRSDLGMSDQIEIAATLTTNEEIQ